MHLIWIPKYRKRVLTGKVAAGARDILRKICMGYELSIILGKIASDHVYLLITYKPQQALSQLVEYLKGASSKILL